jgi:hypothetical protein
MQLVSLIIGLILNISLPIVYADPNGMGYGLPADVPLGSMVWTCPSQNEEIFKIKCLAKGDDALAKIGCGFRMNPKCEYQKTNNASKSRANDKHGFWVCHVPSANCRMPALSGTKNAPTDCGHGFTLMKADQGPDFLFPSYCMPEGKEVHPQAKSIPLK